MSEAPALPLSITDATRPFWEAAEKNQLAIPRCAACHRAHWYPRHTCPFCGSRDIAWEAASGDAELVTYAVAMQRFGTAGIPRDPPYVVAIVRLAEGPTMTTSLVDCPPEQASIGMRLKARFLDAQLEAPLLAFAPAAGAGTEATASRPR